MSNQDPSNSESNPNWSLPSSSPPEDVLEAFTNELKHPLTSIKGWVKILSSEANKESYPQALESILTNVERIEMLISTIKLYLKK